MENKTLARKISKIRKGSASPFAVKIAWLFIHELAKKLKKHERTAGLIGTIVHLWKR